MRFNLCFSFPRKATVTNTNACLRIAYRKRLASRSDSSRHRISSSRTVAELSGQSLLRNSSRIAARHMMHARRGNGSHTSAFDVADDGSGLVVHELDAHLRDATTRTCNLRSAACCPSQPAQTLLSLPFPRRRPA